MRAVLRDEKRLGAGDEVEVEGGSEVVEEAVGEGFLGGVLGREENRLSMGPLGVSGIPGDCKFVVVDSIGVEGVVVVSASILSLMIPLSLLFFLIR